MSKMTEMENLKRIIIVENKSFTNNLKNKKFLN